MKIRSTIVGQYIARLYEDYIPYHLQHIDTRDSAVIIKGWCESKGIGISFSSLPERGELKVGGTTDGFQICLDLTDMPALNFYLFFHELAHLQLHFNPSGIRLSKKQKEVEADLVACFMCDALFPGHYEKFLAFARKNPVLSRSGDGA